MENFVYTTTNDGGIKAGGYNINSELLTTTIEGGGMLNDMLVPAGLFLSKKILEKGNGLMFKTEDNNEIVGDDLYSKLLNLAQPYSKTKPIRKTRRIKRNPKNKTSRRKR